MPHQGIVSLSISALSIALTLGVLFYALRAEKRQQGENRDEH